MQEMRGEGAGSRPAAGGLGERCAPAGALPAVERALTLADWPRARRPGAQSGRLPAGGAGWLEAGRLARSCRPSLRAILDHRQPQMVVLGGALLRSPETNHAVAGRLDAPQARRLHGAVRDRWRRGSGSARRGRPVGAPARTRPKRARRCAGCPAARRDSARRPPARRPCRPAHRPGGARCSGPAAPAAPATGQPAPGSRPGPASPPGHRAGAPRPRRCRPPTPRARCRFPARGRSRWPAAGSAAARRGERWPGR
jgi:hypothetical protein